MYFQQVVDENVSTVCSLPRVPQTETVKIIQNSILSSNTEKNSIIQKYCSVAFS